MCFFYQNPNIAGLRHLKHIHLKRKLLLLLLKKKGNSSKLLTSGYIYICTQAIILLLSGVFLTGVIHFCTQKSCIFKCLWWISCSNFEPFSRIFNAQTSTKTWVGTCAHKQQLLCHSPVDPHRHPWIPTGTHGVTECCAHLPCPAVCQGLTGAGVSQQVCRVRLCHLNCKTCLRPWAAVRAPSSSVLWGHKGRPLQVMSTDRIWGEALTNCLQSMVDYDSIKSHRQVIS